MTYHLTVQAVEAACLFELRWGQGQRIKAQLAYPPQLESLYQQWQRAYLSFYRTMLRGRSGVVGQVTSPTTDLHSQLIQAEARLLLDFHRWLRQGELTDIRRVLTLAARERPVDLFLTCDPLALARLPWETWEIGAEVGGAAIRIARAPATIRVATQASPVRRRKTRVLVILGDDTGLDLAGDRQALAKLDALVEITWLGWTPGQDPVALKQAICRTIADEAGWDILFFAGHSNESVVVEGQLYVAPYTALSIKELQPYLEVAQTKGLQFSLFNSCSGLTIAEALIDLGLSQVAVMREPIHNRVAQAFLLRFLHRLAQHEDGQTALMDACQYLHAEQHISYPSAYLVPSLFRHPASVPFRIERRGWRQHLRQWLPTRRQAAALAGVVALSLWPGAQEALLSGRLLTQAMYRNLTGQLPETPPEVVLVQVDEASRRESPLLRNISPINQQYLAELITVLANLDAPVVGVDYLLDLPPPASPPLLAQSIRQSVAQTQTWLVFSAVLEEGQEVGVNPEAQIIDLNWAMEGYTNAPRWYLALPWEDACQETCPFSYLLALTARYQQVTSGQELRPALTHTTPLRSELLRAIPSSPDAQLQTLGQLRVLPITALGKQLRQRWLRPIVDFSLPPNRLFHRVSAYEVSGNEVSPETAQLIAQSAVVLIGGVEYTEGGIGLSDDIHPNPPAVDYWRSRGGDSTQADTFAGVEAIAYRIHHLLRHHLVTPIPALWVVGLAAIVGQAIALYGLKQPTQRRALIVSLLGTLTYGGISVQSMIWFNLIWPWLLPSTTIWIYLLPKFWKMPKS